jgi:hypothetical protein
MCGRLSLPLFRGGSYPSLKLILFKLISSVLDYISFTNNPCQEIPCYNRFLQIPDQSTGLLRKGNPISREESFPITETSLSATFLLLPIAETLQSNNSSQFPLMKQHRPAIVSPLFLHC